MTCGNGEAFEAERVIVATGFGAMNISPIPGIENTELYWDAPVGPAGFTDQRVFVIGKGKIAFEMADNLTEHAAVRSRTGSGDVVAGTRLASGAGPTAMAGQP